MTATTVRLESYGSGHILRDHGVHPADVGGVRVVAGDTQGEEEWLAAAATFKRPIRTTVPRERRILIVTEPNGYFPPRFSNQFAVILAPFPIPGFTGARVPSHGALPVWLAGNLDYAALRALDEPAKDDRVSVVISRKSFLPGHRKRLKLVRHLVGALGPRITVFGRDIRPIGDKVEAILPSKYHLVLENSQIPDYWTEKLKDAFVGRAFPFVVGPPNLEQWIPAESFLPIDPDQPEEAARTISRAIDDNLYDSKREAIAAARRIVLDEQDLCSVVARTVAAHANDAPRLSAPAEIRPAPRPPFHQRASREMRRFAFQMLEAASPMRIDTGQT